MPVTITKIAYTFDELSEPAKEHAREQERIYGLDYDWYDAVEEGAKECAACLGIALEKLYFSGFACQGDGACFEGTYDYRAGASKLIREHAPLDTELHRLATDLQAAQKPYFYQLDATVRQRGGYMHAGCTDINVTDKLRDETGWYIDEDVADSIKEPLRDFMGWIYRQLEKEYEWLMSDEYVDECITINERLFDERGNSAD